MGKIVGIDLGTTNSVVAIVGDYGGEQARKIGRVSVLPDEVGRLLHASAICDCNGEMVYGEDAKDRAAMGFAPIRFWKRYMGKGIEFPLAGKPLLPQDLSREFLLYLKRVAEQALGDTVDRAVITHPAYFGGDAIAATRAAGDQAGLRVGEDGLMMEPIAAALAYLQDDPDPDRTLRVMVYDLGGGTFDITVLERSNRVFKPLVFDGDPELGGYNFDIKLAEHLLAHLRSQGYQIGIDPNKPEQDSRWATLMQIAEDVKVNDFFRPGPKGTKADIMKTRVFTDDRGKAVQLRATVTREQFEAMILPKVDHTIALCKRALEKAKLGMDQIDRAILVGGSSRLALVQRRLQEEFGRPFELDDEMVDLCVAIGAAIYAGSTAGGSAPAIGGFKLEAIPPETRERTLVVAGAVQPTAEVASVDGCAVTLTHDGNEDFMKSDATGRFYFEADLKANAANAFDLRAVAPNHQEIAHHTFVVRHSPGATEQGPEDGGPDLMPNFLAKRLCVDTANEGLKEIAAEGRPLPTEVLVSNLRTSDSGESTKVTIELYQDDQLLTDIKLDKFSAPAPPGTPVELVVHVGKDYSMSAKARIPAVGATAERKDIKIPAPPRPTVEALRADFERLKASLDEFLQNFPDGEEKIELDGEAGQIVDEVAELLASAAPDVYRIQRLLQNLDRLMRRPQDEGFIPSRAKLTELFGETRRLLPEAEAKDPTLKRQELGKTLDVLEQRAEGAYENRDRQTWGSVAKRVEEVARALRKATEPPPPPPPPPPVLAMMLQKHIDGLEEQARENGRLSDPAVQAALRDSRSALRAVDISRPDAFAQLVAVYQGPISRLEGVVAGKAKPPGTDNPWWVS